MAKKKKDEFDPLEAEISIGPVVDGAKGLLKAIGKLAPSQDKELAKTEKKYRRLKARFDAKRKRKALEARIETLEREEAKLE